MNKIKHIPISFVASNIVPIAVTVIPGEVKPISVIGKFRPIVAVIDVPVGEVLYARD